MATKIPTPAVRTEAEVVCTRRSAEYTRLHTVWTRIGEAYAGGDPYIKKVLIQHPSEVDEEYAERVASAYYLNIPKKIVTKLTDMLFAQEPTRKDSDKEIEEDFNRQGLHANEVMKLLFLYNLLYQRAWVYVDSPNYEGDISAAKKKQDKVRPYAQALSPLQVPDFKHGSDGELDWAIVEFNEVDKSDPKKDPIAYKVRILWTRTTYEVYKTKADGTSSSKLYAEGVNNAGAVPLVPYIDLYETATNMRPPMEDIVGVSDAVTRGESELLTNILKQAYGLLILPASFLSSQESYIARVVESLGLSEEDDINNNSEVLAARAKYASEISRSKCIVEDETENGITRYISPDGVTTESITKHNDRLILRLYDLMGLVVATDTTQRQSADSKAWNNMDMTAFLQTKAQQLEQVEKKTWKLLNAFDDTIKEPTVTYNTDFAVKDFKSLILGILELARIDGGPEYQKAIKSSAAQLLSDIKKLPEIDRIAIKKEIDEGVETDLTQMALVEFRTTGKATEACDDSLNAKSDYDTNTKKSTTTTQTV